MGAGGRWDADPAPCSCQSAPGGGGCSNGTRNMAAAACSFGPEREAEPVKEARVVGSELVDTYTVCRGRGRQNWRWWLEPGVQVGWGRWGASGPRHRGEGGSGGLDFEEGNLGKGYGFRRSGKRVLGWVPGWELGEGVRFQK